ncbi:hypothetical protein I79_014936 [Cricetulus griseus]|uniref:Uncharacterized protein n=1 Tax=Cricetulus griseus TaxID=10029 RepID=G3HVE9_CRIGR|nr:hypothetical protein I79_014936 [Cricetulus griseus]
MQKLSLKVETPVSTVPVNYTYATPEALVLKRCHRVQRVSQGYMKGSACRKVKKQKATGIVTQQHIYSL